MIDFQHCSFRRAKSRGALNFPEFHTTLGLVEIASETSKAALIVHKTKRGYVDEQWSRIDAPLDVTTSLVRQGRLTKSGVWKGLAVPRIVDCFVTIRGRTVREYLAIPCDTLRDGASAYI